MQVLRRQRWHGTARDGVAVRGNRAGGPVPDADIGHRAFVEVADFVVQPQGFGRAACGGVQQRPRRQPGAAQRLHLVRRGQRARHRQGRAAADVCGQRDGVAGALCGAPVEQAAAQEQVAGGAVCDVGAGVAQQRAVGVVEPDAVGQRGALVQQAGAGVDVEIAARFGEQLADPAHLVLRFGHMRLHVQRGVGAAQRTGHRQLFRRAGGGEAHRHREGIAALVVPACDLRFAVAAGAGDVVAQAFGGVAIHQHLAGDEAHAALLGRLEQRVGRNRVHGREDLRRRGAVRQQRIEETRRALLRHGGIGKALFGREGVGIQPVEQAGAVAGDHVQLRRMDVGVDEAGHQQSAAVVFTPPVGAGVQRLRTGDAAVFVDQQPVVGPKAHALGRRAAPRGRAGEVEQVGADGCSVHAATFIATPGSERATSRTCSRSQRIDGALCVSSCHSW